MNDLEVRGYRWRHLFAFALMFAFVQQLHYLLRRGHFEPEGLLPVPSACVLLGLFGSSERYHLRVVDGVLSGPARHGRRRVQFAVTEIDLRVPPSHTSSEAARFGLARATPFTSTP